MQPQISTYIAVQFNRVEGVVTKIIVANKISLQGVGWSQVQDGIDVEITHR